MQKTRYTSSRKGPPAKQPAPPPRDNLFGRSDRLKPVFICGLIAIVAGGCTHIASRQHRVRSRLQEESRALTTAVVETLQLQPLAQRDAYSATALIFAK